MKVRSRIVGAVVALGVALGGVSAISEEAGAVAAKPTKAGQFCAKADVGKVVTASNGVKVICKKDADGRNRWIVK